MKAHCLSYLHRIFCIAGLLSASAISAAPPNTSSARISGFPDAPVEVAQLFSMAFDDNLITGKVRAVIGADPITTILTIGVDTVDGVVVVKGIVPNSDIAVHLIQLVASVEGVRSVHSKLKISTTGLVLLREQVA